MTATIAGVSEPARIDDLSGLLSVSIPAGLWAELEALAVPPDLWLH